MTAIVAGGRAAVKHGIFPRREAPDRVKRTLLPSASGAAKRIAAIITTGAALVGASIVWQS